MRFVKSSTFARRILSSVMVLGVATSIGIASAQTASADPGNCPATYACGWKDRYFVTGGSATPNVKFKNSVDLTRDFPSWDDTITSIYNNGTTGKPALWYVGASHTGPSLGLPSKVGFNQLNATHPSFNDTISSAKF